MRHDWIIDVLVDLRGVARGEGLPRLAEQIEDTLVVAAAEIARDDREGGLRPPELFLRAPRQDARRH